MSVAILAPFGPARITCVWMTVSTVAEILADRGVKLHIHPFAQRARRHECEGTAGRGPGGIQEADCGGEREEHWKWRN